MMDVVNETRGFTICEAEYRSSFWGRFRGLMLSHGKNVVLAGRRDSIVDATIHMMFMLHPIDVVWVNSDMEVVDVRRNVKPSWWRLHRPSAPAKYVVEVGLGDINGTVPGDKIAFKRP